MRSPQTVLLIPRVDCFARRYFVNATLYARMSPVDCCCTLKMQWLFLRADVVLHRCQESAHDQFNLFAAAGYGHQIWHKIPSKNNYRFRLTFADTNCKTKSIVSPNLPVICIIKSLPVWLLKMGFGAVSIKTKTRHSGSCVETSNFIK